MAAGLTTKSVNDGTGTPFNGYFYDDGTAKLAPSQYVPDGYAVTIGSKTDTTWDGVAASASAIAILRRLGLLLSSPPSGAALDSSLQSILTALTKQRSESLWTDDTNSYFVRVEIGGVLTWTDLSGNATSAPGTGARPAAGASTLLDRASFQAIAAASGYSIGDYVDHFITTDPVTGAVIGNFWVNISTGLKLASAPASGNIAFLAPLPSGAAVAAKQPQPGIAGTPSADVLSIQGVAGGTPQPTVQPDVRASGTIASATLNAVYVVALANAQGVVGFTVSGLTASGATLVPEASNDGGTTWSAINAVTPGTGGLSQVLTADQQFRINASGHTNVRLRVSVVGTGTITVASSATSQTGLVGLSAALPAGQNTIGTTLSPLPTTLPIGQIKIVTTGTAVQLPSNVLLNGVTIKAKAPSTGITGNAAVGFVGLVGVTTVYDGSGSGNGFPLEPGATLPLSVPNTNLIWINGAAGDIFTFVGN